MKFIPCDEHEDCNETIPIFVTTDIKPDPTSRLYLIDLEHMKIPYCDCINHDMNGNPKCSIHKGKLQTFYPQHDIITSDTNRMNVNHILELKDKLPYCNPHLGMKHYVIKKGYITCRTCIKREHNDRKETMRKLKGKEGLYYHMKELDNIKFLPGRIKDLK